MPRMRDSQRYQAPDRFGFGQMYRGRRPTGGQTRPGSTPTQSPAERPIARGGFEAVLALPTAGELPRVELIACELGRNRVPFVKCALCPPDVRTGPWRRAPLIHAPGTPIHAASECRCGYGAVSRTPCHRRSGCRPSGFRARATGVPRGTWASQLLWGRRALSRPCEHRRTTRASTAGVAGFSVKPELRSPLVC